MNTKKTFLLSEDIYLFSGMKTFLPNLVLVDAQFFMADEQQILPQYKSAFLIVDNRLPLLLVDKWLKWNSSLFIHMNIIVLKMSSSQSFNRGYENFDFIDANISTDAVIKELTIKLSSLSDKKYYTGTEFFSAFSLTAFEKEMLNASFTRKQLDKFCITHSTTIKSLYRHRDKINARMGFDNFNSSLIFLIRNNLLSDTVHTSNSDRDTHRNLSRADYLNIAIMNNEIIPHYQPIVNCQGEISGVEILARWPEMHHYPISQKEFISLSENSSLANKLTVHLMACVAQELTLLKNHNENEIFVSFNVGLSGLSNPAFYWECLNFLNNVDNPSLKLMIEIAGYQAITLTPAIKELIRSLRKRGVLFALDDFGNGYANLHYLDEIELDIIKIDKAFISKITDEEERVPMLESIMHLAKTLGLRMIAEGIEYATQKKWLIKNNIDFLQGDFLLSPAPLLKFINHFKSKQRVFSATTEFSRNTKLLERCTCF